MNPAASDDPVTPDKPESPVKVAIERVLDAGVYAPLGYVLRRDEVRQDLAAAGRKQVAFARSLGRAALKSVGRGADRRSDTPTTNSSSPAPSDPASSSSASSSPASSSPASSSSTASKTAAKAEEVPGYSDMTAKDVAVFLRTASTTQARWILAEESAGKKRVTVLRPVTAMLEANG